MIGIDGGAWDLFEPWPKEGKMPNLKKLMDNGAWAEMESTMPFVTGVAWTSMFTEKIRENMEYLILQGIKTDAQSHTTPIMQKRLHRTENNGELRCTGNF